MKAEKECNIIQRSYKTGFNDGMNQCYENFKTLFGMANDEKGLLFGNCWEDKILMKNNAFQLDEKIKIWKTAKIKCDTCTHSDVCRYINTEDAINCDLFDEVEE